MNATFASLLIACLVATAIPVRAQQSIGGDRSSTPSAVPGPLAQSAAREAARVAAAHDWAGGTTASDAQDPAATSGALELRWNELAPVISGRTITVVAPGGATLTGEVMTVRDDALLLEIKKSSNRAVYPGPSASIPREAVTQLTLERRRGSWGRNMGTIIGVLTGVVVGGYVAGTTADSAGTGIPIFLAIASGITVGGYYVGRAADTQTTVIRVVP
jgi:hypothetical protein